MPATKITSRGLSNAADAPSAPLPVPTSHTCVAVSLFQDPTASAASPPYLYHTQCTCQVLRNDHHRAHFCCCVVVVYHNNAGSQPARAVVPPPDTSCVTCVIVMPRQRQPLPPIPLHLSLSTPNTQPPCMALTVTFWPRNSMWELEVVVPQWGELCPQLAAPWKTGCLCFGLIDTMLSTSL